MSGCTMQSRLAGRLVCREHLQHSIATAAALYGYCISMPSKTILVNNFRSDSEARRGYIQTKAYTTRIRARTRQAIVLHVAIISNQERNITNAYAYKHNRI